MSTRATITIKGDDGHCDIYRHQDGYPESQHGVIHDLRLAQKFAWELPRFEATDFAAAVVAVMKQNPGSVYLTKEAENHGDRAFHYEVTAAKTDIVVKVYATAFWSNPENTPTLTPVFAGTLGQAGEKFCPTKEIPGKSREFRILERVEHTLLRAQEEIAQLTGGRPDDVTTQVHQQIETAVRDLTDLRLRNTLKLA